MMLHIGRLCSFLRLGASDATAVAQVERNKYDQGKYRESVRHFMSRERVFDGLQPCGVRESAGRWIADMTGER